MILLHKNTCFCIYKNSERLNKTLNSVYLWDERWRVRNFTLSTKYISRLN